MVIGVLFVVLKKNIHIHHLNYKNLYDVQADDLKKLCKRCHFLGHKLERAGKIVYRNTNTQSKFAILKARVKKELGFSNINLFKMSQEEREKLNVDTKMLNELQAD